MLRDRRLFKCGDFDGVSGDIRKSLFYLDDKARHRIKKRKEAGEDFQEEREILNEK